MAGQLGVPFLDMHSTLKGKFHTGFLWWDFVHLTDYGQSLVGDRLAAYILDTFLGEIISGSTS